MCGGNTTFPQRLQTTTVETRRDAVSTVVERVRLDLLTLRAEADTELEKDSTTGETV